MTLVAPLTQINVESTKATLFVILILFNTRIGIALNHAAAGAPHPHPPHLSDEEADESFAASGRETEPEPV